MALRRLNRPAGQLTETCDIILTPITDNNGQPAVREVKRCSLALDAGGGGAGSSVTSSLTTVSNTDAGNTVPSTATSDLQPFLDYSQVSSTVIGSPTHTESTPAASSPSSGAGISADDTNPAVSGASAAAESSGSNQFDLPGKTMSVLPIGLGVFAGISVIALIVVGLVTYERTKYRKVSRSSFSGELQTYAFDTRLSDNENSLNQEPIWDMVVWREYNGLFYC
ncbi:hypothetical protein C0993_000685 [Termitomyces sp. T159_Od127]|nr:hypothetical protein C0993_000685 [Termitomyces sp. T159_Od127]